MDEPAQDLGGLQVVAGFMFLLGQLILEVLGLPLHLLGNLLAVGLLDFIFEVGDLFLLPAPLAADFEQVGTYAFLSYRGMS